jgi:uncharacterized membrane-anchored protein YitT (DUF2179 family)
MTTTIFGKNREKGVAMLHIVLQILSIFFSSVLLGLSYNIFLIPDQILSGGVTGVAMIIGHLFPINTGILIFILNIPIFSLGYFKLGKKFICYSVFSVVTTTMAMQYIPVFKVTSDHLLASVYGGVLSGLAVGFIFRAAGSTGGFDIISLIIRQKRDIPMGALGFALNAVVIMISGFVFGWENALYTIIAIYATGRLIDLIHTTQHKVTLTIISSKTEDLKQNLIAEFKRGLTVWDAEGVYTHERRGVIMMVISRYELSDVKNFIKKKDPGAFVNITHTIEVMGTFRRN